MRSYVLLKKINVQNANAIAGLTYGFPAITNFLGFAHALSRKIPDSFGVYLGGVCVISHENQIRAIKHDDNGDFSFSLTRNPLSQKGEPASINEEGRLNMQVSLLIEINGAGVSNEDVLSNVKNTICGLVPRMRLAGGQIIDFTSCEMLVDEVSQKKEIRKLAPGFVLCDRSDYLEEHFKNLKSTKSDATIFDAWCDFSKLKYRAVPFEGDGKMDNATWHYVPKPSITNPKPGYLIPIASGYYAISELYKPGEVDSVRDKTVPVSFAEIAYSVGEWKSINSINDINEVVWKYTHEHPWYLAKTDRGEIDILEPDAIT